MKQKVLLVCALSAESALAGSFYSNAPESLTLGIGSMAVQSEKTANTYGQQTNGVPDSIIANVSARIGAGTAEYNKDIEGESTATAIQAQALMPITKIGGAKNASGLGLVLSNVDAENKITTDVVAGKSVTKLKENSQEITAFGTVGIQNLDLSAGLTYATTEMKENAEQIDYKMDQDLMNVKIGAAYAMNDMLRFAMTYAPRQYKTGNYEVVRQVLGLNATDNKLSYGTSETIEAATNVNLSQINTNFTYGIQREVPHNHEYKDLDGNDAKTLYNGSTTNSIGAYTKIANFTPRAGYSYKSSLNEWSAATAVGCDFNFDKVVLTADLAAISGRTESSVEEVNTAKTTAFNTSIGVKAAF